MPHGRSRVAATLALCVAAAPVAAPAQLERVRDGSRNEGWNELTVGLGLAHLH